MRLAPFGLPGFWSFAAVSLLLFLAAAKAHGRQVRLERELEGYVDVEFGGRANPPWVEALWRRERIGFWVLFPGSALVLGGLVFLGAPAGLPVVPPGMDAAGYAAALALLWAPSIAFTALGAMSLWRFAGRLRKPASGGGTAGRRIDDVRRDRPAWLESAKRGSVLWWLGVAALAVIASVLAYS